MDYRGFFINLDRSVERRRAIEEQLGTYGLADRYERFPAIDGESIKPKTNAITARQIGCFQSHCSALKAARAHGLAVHIIEDDVILSEHMAGNITSIAAKGTLDQYDIVFTETFIGADVSTLRACRELLDRLRRGAGSIDFVVLDITASYLCGATSYVVPAGAIGRLVAACEKELGDGPRTPFDLFLRNQARAGKLKLGCIFPFVTTIDLGSIAASTIGTERDGAFLSMLAMTLLRYSFFVNSDLKGCAAPWIHKIKEARRRHAGDAQDELIADVLGFAASRDFVLF